MFPPGRLRTCPSGEEASQIPQEKDKLSLSSLILAHSISTADWGRDAGIDFQLGDLQVIPNAYDEYRNSDDPGCTCRSTAPARTGGPALTVEYALEPRGVQPEIWRDSAGMVRCAGEYCRMARMITLGAPDPGDYELHVRVADRITSQTTSSVVPLRIVP